MTDLNNLDVRMRATDALVEKLKKELDGQRADVALTALAIAAGAIMAEAYEEPGGHNRQRARTTFMTLLLEIAP